MEWVKPALPVAEAGDTELVTEAKKIEYFESLKYCTKRRNDEKLDRTKDYTWMKSHMSLESLDKAKSDSLWSEVDQQQDPLSIVFLLKRIHMMSQA